jgi:aminomethyltransferase
VRKRDLPRKSHLYEYHEENGKITEFSGFDMPLWYKGIIDEHMAVRTTAGLFDVSHMGRFWISGSDATRFLGHTLPTNPFMIRDGRAFYSVICNEEGGILDDIITNRFSESKYQMIVNAGNREKDLAWLVRSSSRFKVEITDFSNESALIAVQGPLASVLLQKFTNIELGSLKRFAFVEALVCEERCLISRTGYTGEDGFEITVFDTPLEDPSKAMKIWRKLLDSGKDLGVLPCGLGARDSLRLEAGMCLYGQDIDEKTTPIEASLEFVVNLDEGRDFIGRSRIESQEKNGTDRRRVAFSMIDSGIPRHGFEINFSDKKVGLVTSGSFSPILKKGIGMAYVPTPLSGLGQKLSVDIRGSQKVSEVVPTPFYDTSKYGYKRKKK